MKSTLLFMFLVYFVYRSNSIMQGNQEFNRDSFHDPRPHLNPLFIPTAKKIDCDHLLNQYLQQSLSVDLVEQVDRARNWLISNKKQGRKAVQHAKRQLQRTFRNKRFSAKNFISTESKSLNKLILSTGNKKISHKIFNEMSLEMMLSKRREEQNVCKSKAVNVRSADIYLNQLTKLENLTKNQRMTYKENRPANHFSVENSYTTSRDWNSSQKTKVEGLNLDWNVKQTFPCSSARNTAREWSTNLFTNRILQQSYPTTKTKFHPFLQKTSKILYEPKKKNSKNWKFQIVKHKAGVYV